MSTFSLDKINQTGLLASPLKPKINPEQLQIDAINKIYRVRRISTPFGPCIQVELENGVVFLPRRFLEEISAERVIEMNKLSLGLVFRGMKQISNSATPLFEFVEV